MASQYRFLFAIVFSEDSVYFTGTVSVHDLCSIAYYGKA